MLLGFLSDLASISRYGACRTFSLGGADMYTNNLLLFYQPIYEGKYFHLNLS